MKIKESEDDEKEKKSSLEGLGEIEMGNGYMLLVQAIHNQQPHTTKKKTNWWGLILEKLLVACIL